MRRPEDIPKDVWVAAVKATYKGLGRVDTKDAPAFESVARAILAERERCALVAEEIGEGRLRQSSQAKYAKKRVEARDFESMAMSAIDVGHAIRKGDQP